MARPFKQQRDAGAAKPRFTPSHSDAPPQRLHKLLALAGLGSRRDMEELIANGRVTVNGILAQLGAAVLPSDIVRIDGRPLRLSFEPELPQVLIYHKPEGEIVSQDDPEKRASVFDKLPKIKKGKWIAIGRLDMNTSGLLIFTTSGDLANHFMHPRYEVEREYAVRIFGELTEEQMTQLTQGIELEDGPANFDLIRPQGGEGANHWYQVILREGRNREVRRLFEAFQLPVSRLMRVRFGPINLPPRVKRGQMLKLEQKEVVSLLEWAGIDVPKAPLRQLTQREKDKATTVFMPKVRKQRVSALDRPPPQFQERDEQATQRSRARPSSKNEIGVAKDRVPEDMMKKRVRKERPSLATGNEFKKTAPKRPASRRVRQSSDLDLAKTKKSTKA